MREKQSTIVNCGSLARTLWALDEARLRGQPATGAGVREALDWVTSRFGGEGAYRGLLCAPTTEDLRARLAVPTGEDASLGRGGAAHILGEEAVRALSLWRREEGWEREQVVRSIRDEFRTLAGRPGHFCCLRCSVARWRALTAARPDGWEDILRDGLQLLGERTIDKSGRWRGYPFYYTLLALSETPLAEVDKERRRVRAAAERVLERQQEADIVGRFRRRALEWATAR